MSNLLDKSSIILTPTAYNNGEALCVKPSDGSGDFQFSRNSAATRVNAQGLVENVQILSSNLVQNPSFSEEGVQEVSNGSFTNGSTDWALGTGWSIGEDKAVANTIGDFVNLYQNSVFVVGKTYKTTFTIVDYTQGSVRLTQGGIDVSGFQNAVGTYTAYFTATQTSLYMQGYQSFIGSITNISVKEVGQDWLFSGGAEITAQGARINNTITGANAFVKQVNSNLTIGKSLVFQYDVVQTNGKDLAIEQIGGNISLNTSTIGNNRKVYFEFDRADASLIIKRAAAATDVTITNLSVIEITTDTNLPRINYEGFSYDGSGNIIPNSGCGSWLFEPQSSNLLTYSSDYNNSIWTKTGSASVTSNTTISPDGTQNADTLNIFSGNFFFQPVVGVGTFTLSCYVKVPNGTLDFKMQSFNSTDGANSSALFVATTEWQRFEHTVTVTVNSSFYPIQVSGLVGGDFEIWGAQVEANNISSYIPTEGSAVTRNQDVCTNGGSLATINSTEGTLYFEGAALSDGGVSRIIGISDGSYSNFVAFRYDISSSSFTSFLRGNGGAFVPQSVGGITQTDNNKIALVWDATNFRVWLNGVQVITSATNDLPVGLDTLSFSDAIGIEQFFGKTKALAVWKEALSDQELTELTTI